MPDLSPFSSTSGRMLGPDDISARTFPSARKGLDSEAVRRFLAEVADQVRDLRRERDELRLAATTVRQAPAPKLDDAELTKALGEETAHVLQVARETAHALVLKAEQQASELIARTETLSAEHREESEKRAREITESASLDVQEIIDRTKAQCREMIEEAREVRRRILADLSERRRLLLAQLEQIRIGKDSIIGVIESVATSVIESIDAVRAQLAGADDHARIAVEQAANELDESIESGEDLDALVVEAFAKLPEGASGTLTRETAAAASKVFDIERDEQPRVSSPSNSSVQSGSSRVTAVPEPIAAPSPATEAPALRAPDVTPTAQQVSTTPPPSPATPGTEPTAKPTPGEEHSPVDQLFAKIRASRESEVADAERVLAKDAGSTSTAVSKSAMTGPQQEGSTSTEEIEAGSAAISTGDEYRDRRAALLASVYAELARSLKHALREEQNLLLDGLRNRKKNVTPLAFMPGDESRNRLIEAATPGLILGCIAVKEFFDGGSTKARKSAADDVLAKETAGRLASEIIDAITERLAPGLVDDPDFSGDYNEIVGAAFRDWKVARVEALAGDYVTDVFGAGTVAYAKTKKLSLNWHIDDGDSKCPDCDDNAVAGAVRAGASFPTGHVHPPVHPGCRCFLIN